MKVQSAAVIRYRYANHIYPPHGDFMSERKSQASQPNAIPYIAHAIVYSGASNQAVRTQG